MPLLRFCHALYPVLLMVTIISGVSACVSFQVSYKSVTDYGSYQTVLLQFKVNSSCTEGVKIVNVYGRSPTIFVRPICRFEARTGIPKPNCVYKDGSYFVTSNTSKITELLLVATLENGRTHKKTIHLQQDDATAEPTQTPDMTPSKPLSTVSGIPSTRAAATLTSEDPPLARHSSTSPTTAISTTLPPTPVDPDTKHQTGMLVWLFVLVGFVLLIVTVLSICMGILFWKRGRLRRLPSSPPAPHNVMFHAAQDDRESCVSVLGHDYAEIPDDTDTGFHVITKTEMP